MGYVRKRLTAFRLSRDIQVPLTPGADVRDLMELTVP